MTDLAIRDLGSGSPTLLFVHGFACAMEDWDAQFDALSGQFRCLALDLPGHGRSAGRRAASIADLAAAVAEVTRQAGERVILVGHSIGAKVIRETYAIAPETVCGLVFIDGAFYDVDVEQKCEGTRLFIEINGFPAFVRSYFGAAAGVDPASREQVIARASRLDPVVGRDIFLAAVAYDADRGEDSLRRIGVPVLLLQSSQIEPSGWRVSLEPGVVTPFMDRVRRLVQDAEIVSIPRSSHFPMRDNADEVNAHLRAFAGKLGLTDGAGPNDRV